MHHREPFARSCFTHPEICKHGCVQSHVKFSPRAISRQTHSQLGTWKLSGSSIEASRNCVGNVLQEAFVGWGGNAHGAFRHTLMGVHIDAFDSCLATWWRRGAVSGDGFWSRIPGRKEARNRGLATASSPILRATFPPRKWDQKAYLMIAVFWGAEARPRFRTWASSHVDSWLQPDCRPEPFAGCART